ncbi:PepSY domain-containing protein [Microbulbifer salipaludis]|uniref:PepSY domain-containing protein n=1 Tax=Microbulbifer salipaludis TaxID=187980 RepID=A0ABS3E4L8_9GAMM|nr:PepSY-associated TM helix domain-containing protein [Microbulbifer salipaludis]MBN8430250.1 PepSY domain-containing protein [Microbulbifer salipaludis]
MNLKKQWLEWHNKLGWWALAGILIWAISGITHPMMAWFGPSAAKFFPPSVSLDASKLGALPSLLADGDKLRGARVVKLVPGEAAPLLQVTHSETAPRRYFHLDSGREVTDGDIQQARWLATYYSGRPADQIAELQLQTGFDNAYPSVNRLLPVYRVRFAGDDALTLFIHTETAALASITDRSKTLLQGVFRQLHTFAWLDDLEYGRLILIGLLMLTLSAFAATGLALVFALKRRKIKDGKRRYHRLLGYVLWLPLLGWSASGFYHLLQSSLVESVQGLRLGEAGEYRNLSTEFAWVSALEGRAINSLSLIRGSDDVPLYRVGLAPAESAAPGNRNQRFDGRPSESGSLFVDAHSGQLLSDFGDRDQAQLLATRLAGIQAEDIAGMQLVTRYGAGYDFRNKRLPVWQVDVANDDKTMLFVDPVTGVLVDQSRGIDRAESLSFSLLHKWNHLTPFTGRQGRDGLIVFTLLLLLAGAVLGGVMLAKRKKRRSSLAADGGVAGSIGSAATQ